MIIIDEFHNLTLKNITDKEDYIYKLLNTDIKIMSMSATPRVYELEKEEIDITGLLGEIAYSMPFTDAIKNKLVCDYQIYLPLVAEDVKENHDNIKKEININEVNLSVLDKCSFMCCSIIDLGFRYMICYFQDIKEIDEFIETLKIADEYYALDNLLVDKITCDTKQKDRENIINKFKNHDGVSILCSVKILDECIDIKECDSVFVTYPCKNKVKMVQRLNRCTRINKTKPNKKGGLLLWCDENDDIAYTMSSLKEYDPELVTKVNVRNKDSNIERKDNKKVIEIQVGQTTKYIVGIKVFNMMKWEEWHKLLLEFVEKNRRVPKKREIYSSKNLGSWLQHIKDKIKDKNDTLYLKLSLNKIIKATLDEYLEPNLKIDKRINLILEFVELQKRIPTSFDIHKEKYVGKLLQNLKTAIKNTDDIKYKKLSVNDILKKSLDEYFITHNKNTQKNKLSWTEWKNLLFDFVNLNKRIPKRFEIFNQYKIGLWLQNQKTKIKNKDDIKYKILSENFYVKKTLDECLETNNKKDEWIKLLNEFANVYKRCPKTREIYDDVDLGNWFHRKKKYIKSNDELYIKLSKNIYVKNFIDEYLKNQNIEMKR